MFSFCLACFTVHPVNSKWDATSLDVADRYHNAARVGEQECQIHRQARVTCIKPIHKTVNDIEAIPTLKSVKLTLYTGKLYTINDKGRQWTILVGYGQGKGQACGMAQELRLLVAMKLIDNPCTVIVPPNVQAVISGVIMAKVFPSGVVQIHSNDGHTQSAYLTLEELTEARQDFFRLVSLVKAAGGPSTR